MGDFFRSHLGVGVLMLASTIAGNMIRDRIVAQGAASATETRLQAIDGRIDDLRVQIADERHSALTAAQFAEFRDANDKRLSDIRADIHELAALNRRALK